MIVQVVDQKVKHIVVAVVGCIVQYCPEVTGFTDLLRDRVAFLVGLTAVRGQDVPHLLQPTLGATGVELHLLFDGVLHCQELIPSALCQTLIIIWSTKVDFWSVATRLKKNLGWLCHNQGTIRRLVVRIWTQRVIAALGHRLIQMILHFHDLFLEQVVILLGLYP